jgi:hypothetical protein
VGAHPLGTVAADVALLASVTGQPEIVIKQIDIDDFAKQIRDKKRSVDYTDCAINGDTDFAWHDE